MARNAARRSVKMKKRGTFACPPSLQKLLNMLFNLCCLTNTVTQVIKLSAAYLTGTNQLYFIYIRGMNREHTLYPNAVRNAANGKGFGNTAVVAGNYGA